MGVFIENILDLYKTLAYQKLNAYYESQTIYSALGVQRSENRHSAFLAWLLNPSESHMLKELPLRRFLSLVAALANNRIQCYSEDVRTHLITGNYKLKILDIKLEQSIVGLVYDNTSKLDNIVEKQSSGSFKTDAQNRFDVWFLLQIIFQDANDNETIWNIPVVLENKIYSKEGNATNKSKAQTVRYANAIEIICKSLQLSNYSPLLVYLTPSGADSPIDSSFIHITYQKLLDHVISPASMAAHLQNSTTDTHVMLDGYIRNLSCPSKGDEREYSILAIAQSENENLEEIYNSKAFQTALTAHYYDYAKKLLGEGLYEIDDSPLVTDFWNTNENLFKVVLYNHFKDESDKLGIVNKIIKDSNRDNTRFWVGFQDGKWINTNGRPASKSEASYLIFKAYCLLQTTKNKDLQLTLTDLRQAFPGTINTYYHNRYFQHLFYIVDEELCFDVPNTKYYGTNARVKDGTWDFYMDSYHEFPHVQPPKIRSVKMWRKHDFSSLISKAKEYGIIVKPCDK